MWLFFSGLVCGIVITAAALAGIEIDLD